MSVKGEKQHLETDIDRFLGKQSPRIEAYDSGLLVRIPRSFNRVNLGVQADARVFEGVDIWTAYEVSFLLANGLPVVGVIQFSVPAHSPAIVESKSVKLYLSSFNSEQMGDSIESAISAFCARVSDDISRKTESEVSVRWVTRWQDPEFLGSFLTLESSKREAIDWKQCAAKGLHYISAPGDFTVRWHSSLLRSQCRITQQPDWGDIFIEIVAKRVPTEVSMLAYIMNMRDEEHFHEEIVEAIYYELLTSCQPEELLVYAQYTRRGGVDINPLRCLNQATYASWFSGTFPLFKPTFRQ
ncbi:MAG: NADPH-dependent 7-cyano-7-deazaguanine reductase QueF [Verrucomicrobiota bacterium]